MAGSINLKKWKLPIVIHINHQCLDQGNDSSLPKPPLLASPVWVALCRLNAQESIGDVPASD
eukprot:13946056-Ditylum_brightwellii.AAC.1